ncbi:MAG: hypothetical protein QOG63_1649, partial [Thermoleophilaceae bacterium]|nr:hypothetical protein [Thermoleophilaceae bacterium]
MVEERVPVAAPAGRGGPGSASPKRALKPV